jgi:DNA-binding transcriptional ArsR family regulator
VNRVYQALAHPVRRRVLALLRERDRTAGELAEHFDLAKPTLSGHFGVLREAGLITGDRRGTSITYRLNVSLLEEALIGLLDMFDVQARRGDEPQAGDLGERDHAARDDGAVTVGGSEAGRAGPDPLEPQR